VAKPQLLLVDDDPALAMVLRRWLTHLGVDVVVAHTMAEAVRVLAAMDPAAALYDLDLPDGNGTDLIQRTLRDKPGCAVHVMTGVRLREAQAMLGGMAFERLYEKPISSEALCEIADRLQSRARRATPA
jgi:DNA-binding NtrC family response regulator